MPSFIPAVAMSRQIPCVRRAGSRRAFGEDLQPFCKGLSEGWMEFEMLFFLLIPLRCANFPSCSRSPRTSGAPIQSHSFMVFTQSAIVS